MYHRKNSNGLIILQRLKMKRFFISAIYTSPPTTMGGNTKIMIELINHLCRRFKFIILTTEPDTFRTNIRDMHLIEIIEIPYPYKKFNFASHVYEIGYVTHVFENYFKTFGATHSLAGDYIYSCSDFGPDVYPIFRIKNKYGLVWIATLYLFIPSPIENILMAYKFPFLKYVAYYIYQRLMLLAIQMRSDFVVITNESDASKLCIPKDRIFAFYGGVNIEQICNPKEYPGKNHGRGLTAIFCSRLHPQKGIETLLRVWKDVVKEIPKSKLVIIGNGSIEYESYLKKLAETIGITQSIQWLGYINGEKKYKLYAQSDIFLHGSIYDNNGMVAAEALCTGLPVIMYDHPSLKKIYSDGCIKVHYRSKDAYTRAIVSFFKNRPRLLSQAKVQYLRDKWSWQARVSKFEHFLNNA